MGLRTIIEIDEEKCDGCGLCANGCPEGALKIVDGKARMVGDSLCDGLGACIGDCPRGAITTITREAEPYNEARVIGNIVPKGMNTVLAHLQHLWGHGQDSWYREALAALEERGIEIADEHLPHTKSPAKAVAGAAGGHAKQTSTAMPHGATGSTANDAATEETSSCSTGMCPGTMSRMLGAAKSSANRVAAGNPANLGAGALRPAGNTVAAAGLGAGNGGAGNGGAVTGGAATGSRSELTQWPVQLHLVNPRAPYFQDADLLIAADCTAFACGAFHQALLRGRKLVIACPKLDTQQEVYVDKLRALVSEAGLRSITLAVMEVPCCGGLRRLLAQAMADTGVDIPVSTVVVGMDGGSLTWV